MSIFNSVLRIAFVALLVLTVALPAASVAATPASPEGEVSFLSGLWQQLEDAMERSIHSLVEVVSGDGPGAPPLPTGGETTQSGSTDPDPSGELGPTADPNG